MFNLQYFKNKFSNIPDIKFITGSFSNGMGSCCTLGHCGMRVGKMTEESQALVNLVENYICPKFELGNDGHYIIMAVNDLNNIKIIGKLGIDGITEKERILQLLDIIEQEQNKNISVGATILEEAVDAEEAEYELIS